jgi:hypothetical protein
VNLETPKTRAGQFVGSTDLHLDLVIEAGGASRWKDADEPCAALGTTHLDVDDLIAARDSVYGLLAGPEEVIEAIDDWREFQPEPFDPPAL